MIFRAKIGILEKYLYVFHTLFILYLEGNHTLFGEKIYFIWKFSSGNTAFGLLTIFKISRNIRSMFTRRIFETGPCRVGSVGSVCASRMVGSEFASWPGHTKDHHKNGTNCLPA